MMDGQDPEAIEGTATSIMGNIEWVMYAQIVMQPILKNGMAELLGIFYIVQMMKAVPLYSLYIPASLEIYMEEVRNLVDFQMLEPDNIVGKIWPN